MGTSRGKQGRNRRPVRVGNQTLRIEEIMAETGKSRRTINRYCQSGAIPVGVYYRMSPQSPPLFLADRWEEWKCQGGVLGGPEVGVTS